MILPNTELLIEILGKDWKTEENIIYESILGDCGYRWEEVNPHELMSLMKDWALGKGFYILSMRDEFGGIALASTKKESAIHDEVASEETEAVFKICEWILKQKLQP